MTYETINNEQNVQADNAGTAPATQYQPATATSTAGFAVTSGAAIGASHQQMTDKTNLASSHASLHELDAALTGTALNAVTEELKKRRANWEDGAFKSSNAQLNVLLADSLAFIQHLHLFDAARQGFHALYKVGGLESTKSTSLTTKVVRYVFGAKAKKREFAYAKALTVALDEGVQPELFAEFVEKHGGLEEIRRNGVDAQKKKEQREANINNASAALKKSQPIAAKIAAPKNLKVEGKTNFVAAIMRKEADGSLSIVHVSANETLIESLLANAAKDVEKTAKSDDYLNRRS